MSGFLHRNVWCYWTGFLCLAQGFILFPRQAPSPVGTGEIPGVGGSLSCEKSKWEAKAMDSLWRLCLFVSFWMVQWMKEKVFLFSPSRLLVVVWTSCGCCNEQTPPPTRHQSWEGILMKEVIKTEKEMKVKMWELNKCIMQESSPWSPHLNIFLCDADASDVLS